MSLIMQLIGLRRETAAVKRNFRSQVSIDDAEYETYTSLVLIENHLSTVIENYGRKISE